MQALGEKNSKSNSKETVSILIDFFFSFLKNFSGGAAGMVMMSGGKDEEEEALEKERLKEECEDRAIKNKLWRERRERERLGIPEKKKVDKDLRNEKFGSEMKCKNCR